MGLGPGAWRLSLAVGNLSRHASRASSVRPSLSSHCCSRDAHLSPAAAPRPPGSQRVPCSRDVSRGLSVSLICLVSVIFLLNAVRVCRFIAVLGPDCRPPVVSFSVSDVNTESVSFSALFLASQPPLRGRVCTVRPGACAPGVCLARGVARRFLSAPFRGSRTSTKGQGICTATPLASVRTLVTQFRVFSRFLYAVLFNLLLFEVCF